MTDTRWLDRAACRKADPEWFFPNGNDYRIIRKALAVCRICPVISQCAGFAWKRRRSLEGYGSVWGGLYLTGRTDRNGFPETMTLGEAERKEKTKMKTPKRSAQEGDEGDPEF